MMLWQANTPWRFDNASLAIIMQDVSVQVSHYGSICVFVFGVAGNTLNIIVLSQKPYRSTPCAWIFLVSSVFNLICILCGLTTSIVGSWASDPDDYLDWVCKPRIYILFVTRTVGPWLIVLATIDRWLLSSSNALRRQKSTLKNAKKWTTIIILLSIILYAQQLYCYEANQMNSFDKCYSKTMACRYLTDVTFATVTTLFPIILMTLFGLLTISNVHKSQHRIEALELRSIEHPIHNPLTTQNRSPETIVHHRTNHSLLRMLFIQVFLLAIFTLPLSIDRFYATFASNSESFIEKGVNKLIYNVVGLLYFTSNGIPFYIHTLFGGSAYQKALYDVLIRAKHKICFL